MRLSPRTLIRSAAASLLLLTLFTAKGVAQPLIDTTRVIDTTLLARVTLIAHASGDSVILRWAPTTPGSWSYGNSVGYIVDRVMMPDGDLGENDTLPRTILTPKPLRPWTREEWLAHGVDSTNKMAAVAAQMVFGKRTPINIEGGSNASAVNEASEELSTRQGFALFAADVDPAAAEGLGLRLVDHGLQPGRTYIYRVQFATIDSISYTLGEIASALVIAGKSDPIPEPYQVDAEGLERSVLITVRDRQEASFSGYWIERSEKGRDRWSRVRDVPLVLAGQPDGQGVLAGALNDTTALPGVTYSYRVRGITAFAETGPAKEVEATARDTGLPAQPRFKGNPQQVGLTQVLLEWEVADEGIPPTGFVVERSAGDAGPFRTITPTPLPADARQYLVEDADDREAYYVITAIDAQGRRTPSVTAFGETIDRTPPARPEGVTGTIDTNGVVRLSWPRGKERDLLGYTVMWSNDSTYEFSMLTGKPIEDTTITDTIELNTLTPEIYYRVVAVDTRQNASSPSKMLALVRPDRVPPEGSVFTSVISSDTSVNFVWAVSTSRDLAHQILERRADDATTWETVGTFDPGVSRYEDRSLPQRRYYVYRLITEDRTGLRSAPSDEVRAASTGRRGLPGVDGVETSLDEDRRAITVKWRIANPPQANAWFAIYRSGPGEQPVQIASVPAADRTYLDNDIADRPAWSYSVRVVTPTDESALSNPSSIVLNR